MKKSIDICIILFELAILLFFFFGMLAIAYNTDDQVGVYLASGLFVIYANILFDRYKGEL